MPLTFLKVGVEQMFRVLNFLDYIFARLWSWCELKLKKKKKTRQ